MQENDERLEEVLGWKQENLYPVVWTHPDEANIVKNVEKAAQKGVSAFCPPLPKPESPYSFTAVFYGTATMPGI